MPDDDPDWSPPPDETLNPDADDDDADHSSSRPVANGKGKQKDGALKAWEDSYSKSWELIEEDADGRISGVKELIARGRRKRAMMSETPLRRSIIRHIFIILDLSETMLDKDFRPTRWEVTLGYLRTYVSEWFDQNPLGQMGIILLRDRLSETLVPMGGLFQGNPQEIIQALSDKRKLEPSGEPSLQNGLQMARGGMAHFPSTSSLETLTIFSSISTSDPDGSSTIHTTLMDLVNQKVRCTIISLSGEIKICRQICERTGGRFGVAIDEEHLRELMWETIPPPAQTIAAPMTLGVRNALAAGGQGAAAAGGKKPPPAGDLMVMGFPIRLAQGGETLCACHGQLKRGGYLCPRCGSKMCDVPTDCEVCGLMVVSSPHLARPFWFLFPVANYMSITIDQARENEDQLAPTCTGCDRRFISLEQAEENLMRSIEQNIKMDESMSQTERYRCAKCQHDFCMDCDLYVHHTLHTCPGCSQ